MKKTVIYNELLTDLEERIRAHKLYSKNSLEDVVDAAMRTVKPRSTVLDIGCGSGNFYPCLSQKECFYVGVDISQDLLNSFRKSYSESIVLINSNMDSLPKFLNSSFNAIFSIYSVYYSEKPAELVKYLSNVLADKGILFIGGPSQSSHAKEIDKFCLDILQYSNNDINKNHRINNFHQEIIPKILMQFPDAKIDEIDASLYFPNSSEWARYVVSTPQIKEIKSSKKEEMFNMAEKYSNEAGCFSVSKHITVITAIKNA